MAKPKLDSAKFKKLKGPNEDSDGTVTGTNINTDDDVKITSKKSTKEWKGKVKDKVSGTTWNASVRRVKEKAGKSEEKKDDKGIEKIAVTVTNADGESDPFDTESEVVP